MAQNLPYTVSFLLVHVYSVLSPLKGFGVLFQSSVVDDKAKGDNILLDVVISSPRLHVYKDEFLNVSLYSALNQPKDTCDTSNRLTGGLGSR